MTGRKIHAIFLDVAKAYDSVEHWSTKETLEAYGISEEDVKIIMEMITGNLTRFDTAYGFSEKVQTTAGVRQGDIISPALYILFLNPLLKWLESPIKDIVLVKIIL